MDKEYLKITAKRVSTSWLRHMVEIWLLNLISLKCIDWGWEWQGLAIQPLFFTREYVANYKRKIALINSYVIQVAERGNFSELLGLAHEQYENGDTLSALLYYEKAAEMGFELAQSNAAWLYDHHAGEALSPEETKSKAFDYYRYSFGFVPFVVFFVVFLSCFLPSV